MHFVVVAVYAFWFAILSPLVWGHAIVQLEARGHGNFSDPDHDKLGAVASESAVCSQIGVELIEKGGNAADAVRESLRLGSSFQTILMIFGSSLLARFSALELLVSSITPRRRKYAGRAKELIRCPGMYHSGIGGGGFMLVRGSNGSYEFIDFRETAPAAAFQDMYKNNINASVFGGLARYLLHLCPFPFSIRFI